MLRFLLLALLFTASAAGAQVNRLPPTDSCASDRSFVAFRARLNAAIARRDAAALLAMVSDDMSFSFGDDPGRDGFARAWDLAHPATSRLWGELAAALRLGCARDRQGQLWVPSLSLPDEDAPDDASYEGNMLALPGAVLREAPSDGAPIVATMRWDILMLVPEDDRQSVWAHASLDNDRTGYVRRSQLRSFTDYRAVFEKRRGRWLLTAFVIGD